MSAWQSDAGAAWAFIERFFDALVAGGVEAVCISPGSRSTPLAVAAFETPGLETTLHLDERSASFHALGRAKASRRPVALVCTSGTAAANYLPAIVEAHHSATPLVVLTADRPPELRDWGAGQTIDQLKLFGRYVRDFVEMPIPGAGEAALRAADGFAARALAAAWRSPAGPVHLNWPLREPLEAPSDHVRAPATARVAALDARTSPPTEAEIDRLEACVRRHGRGVVCAGTLDATPHEAAAIARFAARAGWPVLADPLSQLRCGAHVAAQGHTGAATIVSTSEFLLRSDAFGAAARAEVVLRLGGAPVSKAQKLWLAAHPPEALWLVDAAGRWEEPNHLATDHVPAAPAALLAAVDARLEAGGFERGAESTWARAWRAADRAGAETLAGDGPDADLIESDVVQILAELVPEDTAVFLSNSMPIRDVDAFWPAASRRVRFLGNRGANGIDGIPSTALGIAAASEAPVVLLTGDLALLHDVGGLLAAQGAAGSLTIVVLDNDGGGIFSFLPIADRAAETTFETLFRTPHGHDLQQLGAFFAAPVANASGAEALRKALAESIGAPGVRIVRVPIDRDVNVERFRVASRAVQAVADGATSGFAS